MHLDMTIVDLETTGVLNADRVVEVALVRLSPSGDIVDSFESLVNPERDVGKTEIHGITPSMVSAAPTFDELAHSIAERVEGTVLVAHNLPFDSRMLGLEFERLGTMFDQGTGLCTLRATQSRLDVACSQYGIEHPAAHRALEDALVTSQLLMRLLEQGQMRGTDVAREVGFDGAIPEGSIRTLAREPVGGGEMVSPLVEIARAAQLPSTKEAGLAYAESLDRVLLDARITAAEAAFLTELALDLGLTEVEVDSIHHSYFDLIIQAAKRDGQITEQEHDLLEAVAEALELHDVVIPEPTGSPAVSLTPGLHVCFTGSAVDSSGREIDRASLEALAESAGMVCEKSVTKKRCNLLVAADPASSSGKARKARDYGIPVISVGEFLNELG